MQCPLCHGEGEVEVCTGCEELVDNCSCDVEPEDRYHSRVESCPDCGGDGEFEDDNES